PCASTSPGTGSRTTGTWRSEERRVGKEGRAGWGAETSKKDETSSESFWMARAMLTPSAPKTGQILASTPGQYGDGHRGSGVERIASMHICVATGSNSTAARFCSWRGMERAMSVTSPPTLDFFFSSRRRHTRLVSDWSSDVCSSDLHVPVHRQGRVRGRLAP